MTISCFSMSPRSLSVEEAHQLLSSMMPAPLDIEAVALHCALERVLACDIVSPINVPAYTNSAMDGYAMAWQQGNYRFRLVGVALAGHGFAGPLNPGECVRVTTGAPLPEGADTVVMREQVELNGNDVIVLAPEKVVPGQNVRQAGEDICQGQTALTQGTRLKPQHLGLAASLGMAVLKVYSRPRVALFSSGDEVRAPGTPLAEAQIYDTNRFALHGLLTKLGAEVIDLGILPDQEGKIRDALQAASTQADMIITSGGVSVGEADWIKTVLCELGDIGLWRIALRPGRPLAFGHIGSVPFFGLPGNPVAVMVTFIQFVQPMLRHMMGQRDWYPQRFMAIADEPMHSRRERIDYHRGIFRCDEQGQLHVRTTGAQGSNILTSMVRANCLIEIDEHHEQVAVGERVTIQPFGELT
nr:bifunctional molybdopterin-guanine dinucleotide biosynthesis adaptor protein MobB/molybdopterin molybdotransferase MoeA [Phytohalomonas tamaricis]